MLNVVSVVELCVVGCIGIMGFAYMLNERVYECCVNRVCMRSGEQIRTM